MTIPEEKLEVWTVEEVLNSRDYWRDTAHRLNDELSEQRKCLDVMAEILQKAEPVDQFGYGAFNCIIAPYDRDQALAAYNKMKEQPNE